MTDTVETAPRAEIVRAAPIASPTTPMREWNVIVAQAQILAQADIVPGAYRRKPSNIIAAAIAGRAYGWDAMTAMMNGNVIDGKYGVTPEAQLGLLRGQGHSVSKIDEVPGESVTVRGRRRDSGDEVTVTWNMEMARAAGLAGKQNWKQYPDAMLWARAISALCTQLFSDVTLGLVRYTDEEIGDEGSLDADAALPAKLPPPEGWATWEECDAAHDAYVERWKLADESVRRKMIAYAKQSGYERPMTRVELDELEGTLDVELGAPATRVRPPKAGKIAGTRPPQPPPGGGESPASSAGEAREPDVSVGDVDTTIDAASPAAGVAVPTAEQVAALAASMEAPEVPAPDVIDDADVVDETETAEAGGDALPATPAPEAVEEPHASPGTSVPAPPPGPAATPVAKNKLARMAMAAQDAGIERPQVQRLTFLVSNGRTQTRTELGDPEANLWLRTVKEIKFGHVAFGEVDGELTLVAVDEAGVAYLGAMALAIGVAVPA